MPFTYLNDWEHISVILLRAKMLTGAAAMTAFGVLSATGVASAGAATSGTGVAGAARAEQAHLRADVGRAALPAGDGWAALNGGTTGGEAAATADERVVTNRNELVTALGGDNATNGRNARPKIIYVKGRIDGNVDAANQPLSCDDYAEGTGYTLPAFLEAFAPQTWGRTARPTGPLEVARLAAAAKQRERVVVNVGSNTTIIGVGADATLQGVNLIASGANNIIVRNLTMRDASDCFPLWDPTDTAVGNWNSAYDLLTLTGTTNVWVDHNTFTDLPNPDSAQPKYFDRPYQQHDGLIDIIRASDLVTLSWNVFTDHDKTVLIGNSNTPRTDPGTLRVTIHHNLFRNVVERAPRVRFGRVDVYNNWYSQDEATAAKYGYSLGVGVDSHIWAEQNYFSFPASIPPSRIVKHWSGTVARTEGNLLDGHPVDLIAEHNAAAPGLVIGQDTTWTPLLRAGRVNPAKKVPQLVRRDAGAGQLKGTRLEKADDAVRPAPVVLTVDPAAAAAGGPAFATVQAAVDAVPAGGTTPVTVLVAAGRYREVVRIPSDKPLVTLRGATGNPRDVVISYDNANGTLTPDGTPYGTTGSATMTVLAAGTTLTDLTVENAFDEAANPQITNRQAVALKTQADRVVLDRVRLLGNQDTFYANAPAGSAARVYAVDTYVTGDVDFVFGSATLVLHRSVLRALAERAVTPSGYVTAASTAPANRGFLIDDSYLLSDAAAGSYFLGRPWHPGNDPSVVPQVIVRQTVLSAAVGTPAWTDMSGFSWREARFAEFRNTGPGAVSGVVDGRAQLTPAQAATAIPEPWLAGSDGWDPTQD